MKRAVRGSITGAVDSTIQGRCRHISTTTSLERWRSVGNGLYRYPRWIQVRGAKRRTIVAIKSIPQGLLPAEPTQEVVVEDEPIYSITIQQHRNNMLKYPDCVILTKLGNFYEMYFEQAEELAPLLGLKLAKKPTTRNREGFVYMAGFPLHQMDRYLKILVNDLGKHVAISKEIPNNEAERMQSGNMFDRKIIRIITPGTLIDEKFIDPWNHNFLLSIHTESNEDDIGIAWVDLSCGDFFTQQIKFGALATAIAQIGPREILLDQQFDGLKGSQLMEIVQQGQYTISYAIPQTGNARQWSKVFKGSPASSSANHFSSVEMAAGELLLGYVDSTQLEQEGVQLQPPVRRQENEYMLIDKHSLRALEVTSTLRDGVFTGSLLQAVRHTTTQSGARLLAQRLKAPSMSLPEINQRLDLVQEFIEHPGIREDIVTLLKRAYDALRLVSRFAFGKGEPDDLLGLARTIQITSRLAHLLSEHVRRYDEHTSTHNMSFRTKAHISQLLSKLSLEQPEALAQKILDSVDEEGLEQMHNAEDQVAREYMALAEQVLEAAGESKLQSAPRSLSKNGGLAPRDATSTTDVWIMRSTASARLKLLHRQLSDAFDKKDELEMNWRLRTGAKKLTLRWIQPHGHVVHVSGARETNLDFSSLGKVSIARSGTSTRSFYHHEWTSLGGAIEDIKKAIRREEDRVFHNIRKQIVKNIVKLRNNAAVLDELDVACGFATLAVQKNWIRPILNYGTEHHIRGGRHPTVESGLIEQGKQFTSNDCVVGNNSRILLITGPNMGGKSTFLRQNALISILAQTGSFVPAEYAEIGLVDKIFSRVGSADNLYQDQSTFMVEMLETAEILKQATPRSFVIMDEVGRGTTPEDGIAVGFAALHHLYHVNQSRALFATHFHVLADMTSEFEKLACFCTDVAENTDGSFSYEHKLRAGVNRNPHALKVARLAGK